ncbi:putative oxidoreductase [Kitasatospora setae KM-6054]|uniref:Putative oxidoreductase n=1 Tax=Kitasatospora setae (strain ATCC 33774 / DSM 43861 / JCM 3304 / KCC A-0304 / NBRC 14216 / KM-6054) TaxID=452652 RepID=E4NDS0_KITSK|nr:putative oxidoreductase [Kitasatospora setae KM-6054]
MGTFGGPEVLELSEVPLPEPGPGEVRIRVGAAALNPVDVFARAGHLTAYLPKRDRYVLGLDVAGTVDALGGGVSGPAPGQAVVGLSPWLATVAGTHAEYVVLPADAVTAAPAGAGVEAAATLPLNGTTASLAVDALAVSAGDLVVVTGAAGGVGGYAVQLAAAKGAEVVAVAGAADERLVRELGAARFVERGDGAAERIRALAPAGVAGVVDAAALGAPLIGAVRDGGRFAALLAPAAPEAERGITVETVQQAPDAGRLAALVTDVEEGRLTLRVARTFRLAEAAAAHALFAAGGVRGRIVLVP